MSRYLSLGGHRTFLLGVNYWSQAGGPRMWERFDAARVEKEIRTMRGFGSNACRPFVFVPSFMPNPPLLDEGIVARFRTFLDLAARHGLAVYPTLLVGHMSGENWDFPGQAGRPLYTDPDLLAWQVALVDGVCRACRGHPAVAGWVLSNEMPLWGGKSSVATVRRWAERLVGAVHAADPGRPVGIGDGFMNQKGGQNGFDAAMVSEVADWLGPHTYYSDVDPLRHGVQTEVLVRMLLGRGRPVVLEEFGCSSVQASPQNQAAYFRESIHGVLSTGGGGALGWCYGDFDLTGEPPYCHHAFELGFGVVDAAGDEKPVTDEIRAAARLVDRLDVSRLAFDTPRAAIVVPSYYVTDHPFSWEDRRRMRLVLVQAYALALSAGIDADVVFEGDPLDPYDLLLVPSTQKLLEPTWESLVRRAREGATVYVSFFYSDNPFHQGMWWHGFESATGLRHDLKYGQPDLPGPKVSLRLLGRGISTQVPLEPPFPAARLPIRVDGARVVARDQDRRPAFTVQKLGRGRVFFLAYPWEYYLSRQSPSTSGDASHRIYEVLRRAAGLPEPLVRGPTTLQSRVVPTDDGGRVLWIFNRSWSPTVGRMNLPKGATPLLPENPKVQRAGSSARIRFAAKEVQVWLLPAGR